MLLSKRSVPTVAGAGTLKVSRSCVPIRYAVRKARRLQDGKGIDQWSGSGRSVGLLCRGVSSDPGRLHGLAGPDCRPHGGDRDRLLHDPALIKTGSRAGPHGAQAMMARSIRSASRGHTPVPLLRSPARSSSDLAELDHQLLARKREPAHGARKPFWARRGAVWLATACSMPA